mgnify:CR=1 FL=1
MGVAGGSKATQWPVPTVDLGWRNLVVSMRVACAAIAALATAYWLELPEPQWAILTVYLLTQSSAGAALAKGSFRFLGTIVAALCALGIVKLFSQDPILLVASAMAWIFICYYGATRVRNFASYGFMLAGYTGLLVIFEGAAAPYGAWDVAVNRATEISIGVAFASLANTLIMPIYAGAQLRGVLARAFSDLSRYAAAALRPGTPEDGFLRLRSGILANVVKFDALRSYAMFEAREMRADDAALREAVRECLTVIAMARSLYLRLADFRAANPSMAEGPLADALAETVAALEAVSRADGSPSGLPARRADISRARLRLAALRRDIDAMTGDAPLALRADVSLILRRATRMLRALSILAMVEGTAFPADVEARRQRRIVVRPRRLPTLAREREALLQGTRAALAVLVFCLFWHATEWDQGMAGLTGLALMGYQCVNSDDPGKLGWPYFRAVIAACLCAYVVMAHVYPWLEGFAMLAAFLLLVLVPLGLLIGTPRYSRTAGTFTIYFVAAAATTNVYDPNPLDFANFCFGLVFGMFVCLIVARLIPVTSQASRRQAYRRAIGRLLPEAAEGRTPERRSAREIVDLLAAVLPRLKLGHGRDETFLRGMLASASSALELGRLRRAATDPTMPEAGRVALEQGLRHLATMFSHLPTLGAQRETALADGRQALDAMWTELERLAPPAGSPAAHAVLDAASSLRFLADRLRLDQGFLQLAVAD